MWDEMMNLYFPDNAWIRMSRDRFDAFHRFRSKRTLMSWDDAFEALLQEAGEET
jgi:hypothetical protein